MLDSDFYVHVIYFKNYKNLTVKIGHIIKVHGDVVKKTTQPRALVPKKKIHEDQGMCPTCKRMIATHS